MSDQHPYSLAFERDGIVYVSGAAAIDADHNPILGDRECIEAAFEAVRSRLAVVGLGLEHVVSVRAYLTRFEQDYGPMNAVYRSYFPPDRLPARTCVGVTGLARGALVEIDLVARRPG